MDKGRIRATTIISQVTSCHGRRWEKILKFRVFECFDPYFMGYCCGIDQYHFVVRNSWYFELWINYQGNNLVVRGKKTIKKKKTIHWDPSLYVYLIWVPNILMFWPENIREFIRFTSLPNIRGFERKLFLDGRWREGQLDIHDSCCCLLKWQKPKHVTIIAWLDFFFLSFSRSYLLTPKLWVRSYFPESINPFFTFEILTYLLFYYINTFCKMWRPAPKRKVKINK